MNITDREQQIIEMNLERGYIVRSQFHIMWRDERTRRAKIFNLLSMGLIRETDNFDKFDINKERYGRCQNTRN